MEKQVNYKQTSRILPYPRVEWVCEECGFLLCICEGYNMDYRSNDYGKVVYPHGKCIKCKGEIVSVKSSDDNSNCNKQIVSGCSLNISRTKDYLIGAIASINIKSASDIITIAEKICDTIESGYLNNS